MRITATTALALIMMATAVFAQDRQSEKDNVADTIDYIKRETLGGKLDFSVVLKNPGEVITHSNGVRFNKNDYHVFLWGDSVRKLGLVSNGKAANLWEEIHHKKLTGPQRTALRLGVEGEFER